MKTIYHWLRYKWSGIDPSILQSYQVAFSGPHGEAVLKHLMDEIYCKVCHSKDPIELAMHNGRRSVVQEILENIDLAENPRKYEQKEIEVMEGEQ